MKMMSMRVNSLRERRMDMEGSFTKMARTTLVCGKITNGMAKADMLKITTKYKRVNGKMET